MTKFFKFTFLKLITVVIIGVLRIAVDLFYGRNLIMSNNKESLVYNGNILLNGFHYFFEIIFYPLSFIGGLFTDLSVKLFGQSIYFSSTLIGMFFNFIGLLVCIAYYYLLICLIFYIANKIKKTAK